MYNVHRQIQYNFFRDLGDFSIKEYFKDVQAIKNISYLYANVFIIINSYKIKSKKDDNLCYCLL